VGVYVKVVNLQFDTNYLDINNIMCTTELRTCLYIW
jgi:hypothetical protein